MKGILILAHGSKNNKDSIDILNKIIDMVKKDKKDLIIEGAFISFFKMNIETGIKSLIDKGVDDIYVIPYFLFEGTHVKKNIPDKINNILKAYPEVTVKIGKTLGTDPRLSKILIDRIDELNIKE